MQADRLKDRGNVTVKIPDLLGGCLRAFNIDKELDRLLEAVADPDEQFLSVAFMVADDYGIRGELKEFLSNSEKRQVDVWREIAVLCKLEVHASTAHRGLIYPRARNVRFCVSVEKGVLGSGFLRIFPPSEACITEHIDSGDPYSQELMYDYLERDATEGGYGSVFVLVGSDDPDEAFLLSRGYALSPKKDPEELCERLGAYVLYEKILSKKL